MPESNSHVAVAFGGASGHRRGLRHRARRRRVRRRGRRPRLSSTSSSEPAVAGFLDGVVDRHGRVDGWPTAPGSSTLMAVADHDVAEFRRVVDVNLTGGMIVMKHAARVLTSGGSITSLTSLNARQPGAGMAAYCSAKRGAGHAHRGRRAGARPARDPGQRGLPGPGRHPAHRARDGDPRDRGGLPRRTRPSAGPGRRRRSPTRPSRSRAPAGRPARCAGLNGGAHLQRYPRPAGPRGAGFGQAPQR